MRKKLLIILLSIFAYTHIPDATSAEPIAPKIAAIAPSDGLDAIYNINPLIYTIVIGLLAAIGALAATIRTIWKKYEALQEQSTELHTEKLRIALSTTETIKEALFLVQNIYDQVSKLNSSDIDKRLVDMDIKNHLINISNDIEELKVTLKSRLNER
jgi:hypothetical protein